MKVSDKITEWIQSIDNTQRGEMLAGAISELIVESGFEPDDALGYAKREFAKGLTPLLRLEAKEKNGSQD